MQGWQYGKGLIYYEPIFQNLAFLRARAIPSDFFFNQKNIQSIVSTAIRVLFGFTAVYLCSRGVLNKVLQWEAPLRDPTLTLSYTTFEGTPFGYLLLTNATPFTYLV